VPTAADCLWPTSARGRDLMQRSGRLRLPGVEGAACRGCTGCSGCRSWRLRSATAGATRFRRCAATWPSTSAPVRPPPARPGDHARAAAVARRRGDQPRDERPALVSTGLTNAFCSPSSGAADRAELRDRTGAQTPQPVRIRRPPARSPRVQVPRPCTLRKPPCLPSRTTS
jgi:hypothetical protein